MGDARKRRGVMVQQADARFVPVIKLFRERIERGEEKWGEQHFFPAVATEEEARDAKSGLYRAARHLRLSAQVNYDQLGDGTFQVWARIWTREMARAEIARRVQAGEQLAYNVMRRKV